MKTIVTVLEGLKKDVPEYSRDAVIAQKALEELQEAEAALMRINEMLAALGLDERVEIQEK